MHPGSVKARHLAAPALVVMLAAGVVLAPWKPRWALAAALPYLTALSIASGATVGRVQGREARRWVPAAFAAMHLGWGVGFWEGMAGAFAHHQDESVR
jgi:hypothetical protein